MHYAVIAECSHSRVLVVRARGKASGERWKGEGGAVGGLAALGGGGGLPRVVRRALADLPTCRLAGLSVCWEVGDLESWRGAAGQAEGGRGEVGAGTFSRVRWCSPLVGGGRLDSLPAG